jgi:hypothetical protein
MWHDIKNIFHFIIIFQCLLFSFYLLSQKNARRLSNRLLAGFLLSKAITEIGGVLYHFGELKALVSSRVPHLFYVDFPFHYLYVPVLFLYILSLTKKDFIFLQISYPECRCFKRNITRRLPLHFHRKSCLEPSGISAIFRLCGGFACSLIEVPP